MPEGEIPLQTAERLRIDQRTAKARLDDLGDKGKESDIRGRVVEGVKTGEAEVAARTEIVDALASRKLPSRPVDLTAGGTTPLLREVSNVSHPKKGLWQQLKTRYKNTAHAVALKAVRVLRRPPL